MGVGDFYNITVKPTPSPHLDITVQSQSGRYCKTNQRCTVDVNLSVTRRRKGLQVEGYRWKLYRTSFGDTVRHSRVSLTDTTRINRRAIDLHCTNHVWGINISRGIEKILTLLIPMVTPCTNWFNNETLLYVHIFYCCVWFLQETPTIFLDNINKFLNFYSVPFA